MTNQEIENLTDAQIEDMTQEEMLQIYGCSECGREAEEFCGDKEYDDLAMAELREKVAKRGIPESVIRTIESLEIDDKSHLVEITLIDGQKVKMEFEGVSQCSCYNYDFSNIEVKEEILLI